ncbi:carboxypeptidase-like regulatory domain-containing protein [Chryseobacterium sp. Tr-659]|uniref:carboxypeptidase-like regulatory domain-containing protein n=1 Tax=Chryseobacterium sp. Tr-659 TaxID=2608340 RepID=UPI001E4BE73A|nr:carboxypeptidase-like regulatory domain-containing protein [Chryseobacterium sp. Tr-659]
MRQNYLFIMLCTLVLLVNCKGGDDSITPEDSKTVSTGKIEGKVFAKNGTKPIGGAIVFTIDNKNQVYHTYSDADGTFSLTAPEGNTTLHIQTGNGLNFRTEVPVTVKKNETTSVDGKDSKLNQIAKIAYVKGSYDEIEDIITNLGYTATEISYHDLKNLNTISQYDIIFLNCGSRNFTQTGTNTPGNDLSVFSNLSTFITNGGSIYSSDWAAAYLVGGDKNVLSCGLSTGFIDFTKICFNNGGNAGIYNNCNVSNTAMAASIGFSTLDIQYDQSLWEKIQYYDSSFWEVLVQKGNEALMIRTNKYTNNSAPKIPVGTSLNNNHMTICHHTANGNTITITINQNAWNAHQAHGDYAGSCTGTTSSGNIYYTTFHNHASGNIGKTGPILEYVILNL